ncbi:hypothetical protein [Burkholderia sp. A1]|uniref:hypothetical protein n=1 Tax=Burkholderia sp. A1 TaxID=148446 RepID=UPI0012695F3A|nr:hypothetical protein [Burkholderia sp. A1]
MDWLTPDTYKSVIAPSITPIIVVIGWIFVSRDNDRRETRKEVRSLLNDFSKRVDALEATAVEYFSKIDNSSSADEASRAEIKIKREIERLDSSLQIINKIYKDFGGQKEFVSLTDTITRHSKFESKPGVIVSLNDQFYLRLALSCNQLTSVLEQSFLSKVTHKRKIPKLTFDQ